MLMSTPVPRINSVSPSCRTRQDLHPHLAEVNYIVKEKSLTGSPFTLPNDFVEYFYYPQEENGTSKYPFSITKDNQMISASNWNAFLQSGSNAVTPVQVPRLTVSTWSGSVIRLACRSSSDSLISL